MENVIISLTTIPTRLSRDIPEGLVICIDSLISQNYENYEIHFNIPYINKYTQELYYVPQWLMEKPKVKIFRTEDYGSITKLLPTLKRVTDPETILIIVDDDLVYHPEMINAHIKNRQMWPECPVGYDGLRSRDEHGNFSRFFGDVRDYYFNSNYRSSRVDILQHFKSISYRRRFFEDDFFDFVNTYAGWADDMTLSAYWSLKKRDRIATYHESDENFKTHEDWVLRGGVCTFPVLRNIHHTSDEGCNIQRLNKIGDDPTGMLWKLIDQGYNK